MHVIAPDDAHRAPHVDDEAVGHAAQHYIDARSRLHGDSDARSILYNIEMGMMGASIGWKTTLRISESLTTQFTPLHGNGLLIDWNPQQSLMPSRGKSLSAMLGLAHEMSHAYHYASDPAAYFRRSGTRAGFMNTREEALTLARETITAYRCDDGMRATYFDAAAIRVVDSGASISADDARSASEDARLHAITKPDLRAFPRASRQKILSTLERAVASLPEERRIHAVRELREKARIVTGCETEPLRIRA